MGAMLVALRKPDTKLAAANLHAAKLVSPAWPTPIAGTDAIIPMAAHTSPPRPPVRIVIAQVAPICAIRS